MSDGMPYLNYIFSQNKGVNPNTETHSCTKFTEFSYHELCGTWAICSLARCVIQVERKAKPRVWETWGTEWNTGTTISRI